MEEVRLIAFQKKGKKEEGFLNIATMKQEIPFEIRRVFWTHDTPEGVIRGKHAHYNTEMVIIAVKGQIQVSVIDIDGNEKNYQLQDSNHGLFIPKLTWHEMQYEAGSIQLVIANSDYDELDYIRDKTEFLHILQQFRN